MVPQISQQRRRAFSSSGIPQIDWADPINVGLLGAWICGAGPLDITARYPGQINGGVTWDAGSFGQALRFNGSTGYILVPAFAAGTLVTAGTYTCWFKTSTGQIANLIRHDLNATLGFNDVNVIRWTTTGGGSFHNDDTTTTYADGKWHFLVGTVNTTAGARTYLDGALVQTDALATGSLVAADQQLQFGGNGLGASNFFTGLISNIRVYKRALRADEVVRLYTVASAGLIFPEDRIAAMLVGAATGATSYLFPTRNWVWNHQAPSLAFTNAAAQKSWVWQPSPPTQSFAVAAAQKSWLWRAQAPSLSFVSVASRKAWAWNANAPIVSSSIKLAQRAWRWIASGPIIPSLITTTLIRYLGPVWRRRRSRPEL